MEELWHHEERFNRIADGASFSLSAFCANMGLLGQQSTKILAERIFRVMDRGNSGHVSFAGFLDYMDVLIHGSQEEKALQSFRLIATRDKEIITYDDFATWLVSIWKSYNVLAGTEVNASYNDIREYFDRLDLKGDGEIDFEEYSESLKHNKQLFEWFDTVNQGIAEDLRKKPPPEEGPLIRRLNSVQQQLKDCISLLIPEQPLVAEQLASAWPEGIGPRLRGDSDEPLVAEGDNDSVSSHSEILLDELELENLLSIADQEKQIAMMIPSGQNLGNNSQVLSMLKGLSGKIEEIKRDWPLIDSRKRRSVYVHKSFENKNNSTVQWGDEDWELILNMMLGIQKAVRAADSGLCADQFTPEDFSGVVRHSLHLSVSSRNKNPCKFSDYAPPVFKAIREQHNISATAYIQSLGISKIMHSLWQGEFSSLIGLLSSGKSGSFFYYSDDSRFVIKTLPRHEYLFLKKILPNYYAHIRENPDSLIVRVYGFHKIIANKGKKVIKEYFIVMSNVFDRHYEIHMKFDLKGSTYKRETTRWEDGSVARKDTDFINCSVKIELDAGKGHRLLEIISSDARFLENNRIMDYSLLVGIHHTRGKVVEVESGPFAQRDGGGLLSVDGEYLYFIGMIDILTYYSSKKKLEYLVKRKFQGDGISCIPPAHYAARFVEFLTSAILH